LSDGLISNAPISLSHWYGQNIIANGGVIYLIGYKKVEVDGDVRSSSVKYPELNGKFMDAGIFTGL